MNSKKKQFNGNDVWTKERLMRSGYPGEPSNSAYFMIRIKKRDDTEPELRELVFDLRKLPAPYWGNYKMAFALVKLKDLKTVIL